MRRIKIGVWLENDYQPTVGGGFSYYDALVQAIDAYTFRDVDVRFVREENSLSKPISTTKDLVSISYAPATPNLKFRIERHIPILRKQVRRHRESTIKMERTKSLQAQLMDAGVDVLFYPIQCAYPVQGYPFIANNWDIGHRSTYAFPEVIDQGAYEFRNEYYDQILPRALMVVAESEAGKKELLQYTHVGEHKIEVMPIFAGNVIHAELSDEIQAEALSKWGLTKNQYFFYPAQFWAHKNHIGLLEAFSMFLKTHLDYKLVLTGSDQGNKDYVLSEISRLNLQESVVFPGFVSIEELATLYRNATALVMASYFGPTNMPPIEALMQGCPVVCSNIAGHREIMGDAAVYFNAMDVKSIHSALSDIVEQRDLYISKIAAQQMICKFTIGHALEALDSIFSKVAVIRSCWK